ncbi:MAG: family N-acetyltransferase [Paenibacillus sp.]|nr:family N-acetyltransferase [Paenibacillus sp.]
MKIGKDELHIRRYEPADAGQIVEIIAKDPFNLQKGASAADFDRGLDEPGERIRENTFAALIGNVMVGYVSLCFVDAPDKYTVYSYSSVDVDWRRRGIGSVLFCFIMDHLKRSADKEGRRLEFVHRVDSRVPGMRELALRYGMNVRNEALIMRKGELQEAGFFSPAPFPDGIYFRSPVLGDAADWAAVYNDAFYGSKTIESVVHEFQSSEFSPQFYILAHDAANKPAAFILSVGVKEVTLSVDSGNEKAQRLYRQFGFTPWAKRSNFCLEFIGKKKID